MVCYIRRTRTRAQLESVLVRSLVSCDQVTLEEQLALYSIFHRNPVNRRLHNITLPIILFTGAILFALVRLPSPTILGGALAPNLGIVFLLVVIPSLVLLDVATTALFTLAMVPIHVVANVMVATLPPLPLCAGTLAVHALAWFVAVQIGHQHCEPTIMAADSPESPAFEANSNLYFRRGYFLLRNVGREPSLLEALHQFGIAPIATLMDVLCFFGYRSELRARVAVLADACMDRIARGEMVFASPPSRAELGEPLLDGRVFS